MPAAQSPLAMPDQLPNRGRRHLPLGLNGNYFLKRSSKARRASLGLEGLAGAGVALA